MIRTYTPEIEVRLIKTARRSELATGKQAASRYQELSGIDLTPFLVAGEPVSIRQQMGAAAAWNISLADCVMPDYGESLYAMIEPNDMIEIRMARASYEYDGGKVPVVLRGFVSSVDRARANMGGQLHRRVHVAGADYSKILDIIRIYYLNNSVVGDNILTEFGLFQKYLGEAAAKIMSAQDFAQLVLDKLINPFIARLTRAADGKDVGAAILRQLTAEVSITGTVSPLSVALFHDGSIRQFLTQFLDVGVFNEMFIDDRPEGSVLVIRPNRFQNINGDLIQDSRAALEAVGDSIVDVPDVEIESITQGRTDAGVANYYWVNNFGWQIQDTIEVSQLAATSDPAQYVLSEYVNVHPARYGFRKMEVSSALGAPLQNYSDAMKADESRSQTNRLLDWLTERRRILVEQNKDNSILEDGQMTIAGNEHVKPGMYVKATFGDLVPSLYYVVGVTHQFVPNGTFKTTVNFERGMGFADRAARGDGQYQAERNMKGMYAPKTNTKAST